VKCFLHGQVVGLSYGGGKRRVECLETTGELILPPTRTGEETGRKDKDLVIGEGGNKY